MKLSVIVPVYNEESTIGEVVERVLQVPFDKEVIIVDDGSVDQTGPIVERMRQANLDVVRVYSSPVNFGKGAAIRIGLRFATGDVVIIQDADLELDPKEYEKLIEPIAAGKTNVVYGSRFLKRNSNIPFKTWLVNRALALTANVLYNTRITDEATAYKVFRIETVRQIPLGCIGFEFCPEITAKLTRMGEQILEVPVDYNPRTNQQGKKLRMIRDGTRAVLTLFRYRFWKPASQCKTEAKKPGQT